MLAGLQKFSGRRIRQRGCSPKLQVLDTALMAAGVALDFEEAKRDREFWGRLVESAVGAHLLNSSAGSAIEVFYWRERNHEVDLVVRVSRRVVAIEVKSGRKRDTPSGLAEFAKAFRPRRLLFVGGEGIPLEDFLAQPAEAWVRD